MNRILSCCLSGTLLSLLVLAGGVVSVATAQPNVTGQWSTLAPAMPINPIHVALLKNGKVLIVAGSGNCPSGGAGCPAGAPYGPSNNSGAAVWDPIAGSFTQLSLNWDMFCNSMVVLADGRVFINGGTLQYDPFHGSPKSSIFDPANNSFTDVQNMAHGRWYPTTIVLGDGRVMTFSGLTETGSTNSAVEFYTVGSGWSQQYPESGTPPLYPRLHLLPNGKVFYSGPSTNSALFDPALGSWTDNVASTNYGGLRTYGSSVLLPLTPANNYDPKVMIFGGGNPATATTEIIDMGAATPQWVTGPPMSQPRIEMNAILLPNGKVLAMGGSKNDEDTNTLSLNADLFDLGNVDLSATPPVVGTRSSAGANATQRLYHSVALLLPDATVWLAGGNPVRGSYNASMEIYKPPYLFNSNGTLATRPTITSAPSSISHGAPFTVQTPDAANISSAVLVRAGSTTHAFNMDQRLVGMSFTVGSGTLTVTAPPNSNIAPPGYYMLFLLNNSGVPSVASFVQIGQQPDFTVGVAPSSQSVGQGSGTTYNVSVTSLGGFNGTVSFSVSGLPSGASATFNPTSVTGAGTTVMSLSTLTSTQTGSYPVTITGTSGALVRSALATLVVTLPPAAMPTFSPLPGTYTVPQSVTLSDTTSGATIYYTTDGSTPTAASSVYTSPIAVNSTTTVNAIAAASGFSNSSLASGVYVIPTGTPVAFVQGNSGPPTIQASNSSVAVAYSAAQTAGNLNVVAVGWGDTTSSISSVTDSRGNVYSLAIGPTSNAGGGLQQSIYYAKNIAAGSNTVTVRFNQAAAYPDVRILEYAGADPNNPLDGKMAAIGTGTTANSGAATTTAANELIFGSGTTGAHFTAAGTGFVSRMINAFGNIAEDETGTAAGSYSATATTTSAPWVMQVATFKASGQAPPPPPPPPSVSTISPTTGTTAGGTSVTITGTGFQSGASVTFGGTAASNVSVVGSTSLTATTPAHTAGAVNVVVTNTDGQSGSLSSGYTYVSAAPAPTVTSVSPVSGPTSGGTSVTITGTNFLSGSSVAFGGTPATNVVVGSGTQVTATTPARAAGAVTVTVTSPDSSATAPVFVREVHSATDGGGVEFNRSTLSINVTGNNPLLIASWHSEFGGPDGWTVDDNGVPGTEIVNTNGYNGGDGNQRFRIYYWLNPAPGTNTVTVALPSSSPNELAVSVILLNNVSQVTPLGTPVLDVSTQARTSESETVATTTTDLVLHVIAYALVTQGTLGSGETSVSVANDGLHAPFGDASLWLSTKTGGAGTTTVSSSGWASSVINGVGIAVHGVTPSGSLNNGFSYLAPPTISGVTPNSGPLAGGMGVTIAGANFVSGATVTFGGTAATNVVVGGGGTQLTATTPAHAGGTVTVVVTNPDGQSASLSNAFSYTSSTAPTVSSTTPNNGPVGGSTPVTLAGTNFLSGATVTFGGTPATNVVVVNGTQITANTPAHASGAVDVVVTNTDGQSGALPGGYTYTSPLAFVQGNSGPPTIQASNSSVAVAYSAAQTAGNLNVVAVGWGDTTSSISSVTDSRGNVYSLAIGPTSNAGGGLQQSIYYAKNIAAGSNTVTVRFNQAAAYPDVRILEYAGADPNNPLDGKMAAIGTGTTANSGAATTTAANELIFGSGTTGAHFTAAGTGFVSRMINAFGNIAEDETGTAAGSYSATATTTSAPWVMQVATFKASGQAPPPPPPPPSVSTISPTTGTTAGGTSVTITGTGFQSGASVTFGGTAASNVSVVGSTSLTATTPAHTAGAVNVVVTNTDGQSGSLSSGFTYASATAPTVSSVTPNSGPAAGNTAVTIAGTNFVAGAQVTFGGTAATNVVVVSGTQITATTPAHAAGAVTVTVTNTDTQSGSLNNGYIYLAAPTVSSVTPSSGSTAGGTGVTIAGTNFVSGATVSFGGTAAINVVVVNGTQITATTPAHAAGAVTVTVTNPDTQSGSLASGFTYTSATAPTVSSVTPNSGPTAGGTGVTIAGTNFVSGAGVTFGGTAATNVVVVSGTQITATTPAHAKGAVNVVVTNTDGLSGTLSNGYTYTSPISFVQGNSGPSTKQSSNSSVAVAYSGAQTAGDLNVVAVGWGDTTSTIGSVTDTRGNVYSLAIGPTTNSSGLRQSIYYAKNIAAGSNTVTVIFNQAAVSPDVRILEYAGADPNNPLDGKAAAVGTGTTANSGAATTTSASELIFGAGTSGKRFTAAGSGFVSRMINNFGNIAEDKTVTTTGSYNATATGNSAIWVMQVVTFK